MKLLLTSCGVYNKSIAQALLKLLNKPFSKSSMVYITTASNLDAGDKSWLIDDLVRFKNLGFSSIDIIDIAAIPQANWLPRIKAADVMVFGGGNEAYLMHWIKKSGLAKVLPGLLKKKVYVGISAGSMVTAKNLSDVISKKIFGEDIAEYHIKGALGLVDFQICPHFNSKHFPKNRLDNIAKLSKQVKEAIFAIDDSTAIQVINGELEIISEGKWHIVL